MRHTEHPEPESEPMILVESNEERLRREIEGLKRQIEEQKRVPAAPLPPAHHAAKPPRPSGASLWILAIVVSVLVVAAFLFGYLPRRSRVDLIDAEAAANAQALPEVSVVKAAPSAAVSELILPGNVEAITEAPVLARSDGYIARRYVDIGDRVRQGELLATIAAPELDRQVEQAAATLQQSEATLQQASANLAQGQANQHIAQITAERWAHLTIKGAVSRQENDQYQAQYQAQTANVDALNKAIAAAKGNVAAARASLDHLKELQIYEQVKAPFAGVITVRNIDVGALITAGSTLLFRIAQTGTLRTYVNVPQTNSDSVHAGQPAFLTVTNLPGRRFPGRVTRTANALDPASRTLLTEVQAPNPTGELMPGMYAQVDLNTKRTDPPLLVPGDALVVRAEGTLLAVVDSGDVVHYRKIDVGRDYGTTVEVLSGIVSGDRVIVNPSDAAKEGAKVKPIDLPGGAPKNP